MDPKPENRWLPNAPDYQPEGPYMRKTENINFADFVTSKQTRESK